MHLQWKAYALCRSSHIKTPIPCTGADSETLRWDVYSCALKTYLKLLVENIHSATIATVGADGHPQTCVIDMMLYDEQGIIYFLTIKGKTFYAQLMEQRYNRSVCHQGQNLDLPAE